jgi:hypothetical protein
MAGVSPDAAMVLLELLLVSGELWAVGAEELPEVLPPCVFCGVTPVLPMGPPDGFCWPAAVAGLGGAVVGGLPCAKAAPAAPRASAAMSLEVLFMVISPEKEPAVPADKGRAGPDARP